jgi:N-methylhydantoinase A
MTYRVGIDVGGTFTDFFLVGAREGLISYKIASTPDDPSRAVIKGLEDIAENIGLDTSAFLDRVAVIVHGTTVTTNALLTRRGAKSALLATKGFRDTLPLRDGTREESYNNRLAVPVPLVPRYRRIGITERIDYKGDEVQALVEHEVREVGASLLRNGVESVAICFMHSPTNPTHEQQAADILREEMPDAYLSVSSDLLSQLRYFDRTSTTVLNTYVAPIMSRYVESLTSRLAGTGFNGILLLMQSNGGVATPKELAKRAVLSLLSGPASGPTAGLLAIQPLGRNDCITMDMGGTSFDAAVVRDGRPLLMTDGWVDRWRLAFPMIDIHTIGAGGGSIANVNEGGLLQVGPDSAGADPGPACYGQGGVQPTVTDADLLLGYLSPTSFLGGRMTLSSEAAGNAVEREVAKVLGFEPVQAAAGIFDVVNVNMATGVAEITIQRGLDPRDFPLVVAGGAGPVHAAAIAREMRIPSLVVPRDSSVFCASGMLASDFKHDYVRSRKSLLAEIDVADLVDLWQEMVQAGRATLTGEGISERDMVFLPSLDMRYRKQWFELNVPFDAATMSTPEKNSIGNAFHQLHDLLFGYQSTETPVEVMNVRVAAVGITDKPSIHAAPEASGGARDARTGERLAWSQIVRDLVPTPVYNGHLMGPEAALSGPAIIELATTTIVVPEDFDLVVDGYGSFVMHQRPKT